MANTAVNKKTPYIIYFAVLFGLALIAAITIVSVYIPLALESGKERLVVTYNVPLVSADSDEDQSLEGPSIPTEYILRQQFDTRGLAISVKGRKIMLNRDDVYKKYVLDVAEERGIAVDSESAEFNALLESDAYLNALSDIDKISVNADLSAAGETQIEIVYKVDDYTYYTAVVPATVYFVRTVEVVGYPEVVSVSDGVATLDSEFSIYATLGSKPQTDAFGEVTKDGDKGWRIKLNDTMYTQSVTEDAKLKQFYTISFYCGNLNTGFSFYNAAGRSFIVSATRDIVEYENTDTESGSKGLTLIVTDRDTSYQQGEPGTTKGNYVYKDGDGVETVYPFSYELTDTDELFKSDNIEESRSGENYCASFDGTQFVADATLWQSAVVNGSIVDDHGFKVVIGSVRRILNFEYALNGGTTSFPTEELPESFTLNADSGDKEATLDCVDDGTWTLVFGTEQDNNSIASGTWEYTDDKKALLTVNEGMGADDAEDDVIFTLDISTAGGTFTYTVSLDITDPEDEAIYSFDFSGSAGTLPSLTLYVTDYDMNPLLGTGNGYSIGKYVYTDVHGNSSLLNFYMQAWVWTFVPLSSSKGDYLSDTTISDYVWDGIDGEDHYNAFYRGTLYSTVSHYDRGNGFTEDYFYAPESLWLNALMNM